MHSRAARFAVVALLLAVGAGAAAFTGWTAQRIARDDARTGDISLHVDRLVATVSEAGAAQAAYVAPGQPSGQWLNRADTLLQQATTEIDALRPLTRSEQAATALQTLGNDADRLSDADARARDSLRLEDPLSAADAIFNEAHDTIETMNVALRTLRSGEAAAAGAERAALEQQVVLAIGGAAALWVIGLLLLARRPAAPVADSMSILAAAATDHSHPVTAESTAVEHMRTAPAISPAGEALREAASSDVDLAAAADLCTDISRMTSAAALPDLLARAAAVLDASGIIVWVGAGDELFAVTAHGYDPRVISRLGAIERTADNATAQAWRTGELRTVPGDSMSNGAIVAPMFGPASCLGVLAAEVRHGRETDSATRAVTAMLAAQLATVVHSDSESPEHAVASATGSSS